MANGNKGKNRAFGRRQARRRINQSDAIGQGKMLGNVVRRGYGATVPDGVPTNYFLLGQDPDCADAEVYGRAVAYALQGRS